MSLGFRIYTDLKSVKIGDEARGVPYYSLDDLAFYIDVNAAYAGDIATLRIEGLKQELMGHRLEFKCETHANVQYIGVGYSFNDRATTNPLEIATIYLKSSSDGSGFVRVECNTKQYSKVHRSFDNSTPLDERRFIEEEILTSYVNRITELLEVAVLYVENPANYDNNPKSDGEYTENVKVLKPIIESSDQPNVLSSKLSPLERIAA